MEPVIIKVNLSNRKKPYQLGIEVVPPDARSTVVSQAHQNQQRQQQASKQQYNQQHEYQNLSSLPNGNSTKQGKNTLANNNISKPTSNHSNGQSTVVPKKSSSSFPNTKQHQGGLLITKIYEGSVIDEIGQFRVGDIIVEVNGVNFLGRTFQEAQKILKTFVEQTSHGPLLLTVLRRASSSSSSIPSTTGSQATVIERSPQKVTKQNNPSPIPTTPKKSPLNSQSTPSSQSSSSARHFSSSLNTRRIGVIYCVKLTKSKDGGFGIKIAEQDNMFGTNRPIYITAITTTGSAYRDGRLKEGDMLLEVNGINLHGKSQPEVTKMLKAVGVNETVEFVVSRQPDDKNIIQKEYLTVNQKNPQETLCDNNESLIDLNVPDQDDLVFSDMSNHQFESKIDSILNLPSVDGPGVYVYDIPLNDTKSAGLGLYLKCPNLDGKDLGIWIEKVITGGAAWKDNRLLPDDQILAINGINLMGLSNSIAYETLTSAVSRGTGPEATSNTVRLNIHRRDPVVVAKLLHGTNNRIEHSDLPTNGLSRCHSISDKTMNSTQDSFKTALNNTIIHSRSQSSNSTSGSNTNELSNQNSHNDSAMSPQTQASNSIKLSSSGVEKLDQNTSDSTNDTSSAISQITDFTFLPVTNDTTPEKNFNPSSDNQPQNQHFTIPKTIESAANIPLDIETASSTQSFDNETGEDRFQRDGFGRQSISEKRHTQLMANTDTFRRNQKLREERERQRQIAEQLEKMQLEDERRPPAHHHNYESQTLMRSMFRNRRLNESFRAAVDRSYNCGTTESEKSEDLDPASQKKNSSFFSKFLKFGSMKKSKKKIASEQQQQHQQQMPTRPNQMMLQQSRQPSIELNRQMHRQNSGPTSLQMMKHSQMVPNQQLSTVQNQLKYLPINDVISVNQMSSPTHMAMNGTAQMINHHHHQATSGEIPNGQRLPQTAQITVSQAPHHMIGYPSHQQHFISSMNLAAIITKQQQFISPQMAGPPFRQHLIQSNQIHPVMDQRPRHQMIRPPTLAMQHPQMQYHLHPLTSRVFRAMYDYEANDVDEVSFFESDFLVDCVEAGGNWLIGKVARTGQQGMFPANYVTAYSSQ